MSRKVPIAILILIVLGGGVLYWRTRVGGAGLVLTGIVTTDEVTVSPQIAGRMSQLLVKEGDAVSHNQLLAVIDPEELKTTQEYYAHTEESSGAQVKESEAA